MTEPDTLLGLYKEMASLREQLAESEWERENLAAEKRLHMTIMEKRKVERERMEEALREIAATRPISLDKDGEDAFQDFYFQQKRIARAALNPNTDSTGRRWRYGSAIEGPDDPRV